jgi:hypothetical protein
MILLSTNQASADFVYVFDQFDYRVKPNQEFDVRVFLEQTDPTDSDPVNLSTDGLISASVEVNFSNSTGSDPAEVLALSDIIPNPQFDDTGIGAEFELNPGVSAGFADGVQDVNDPLTGSNILLGTFRFTAGGTLGEVTSLVATDLRPLQDTVAGDEDRTALDDTGVGILNGDARVTVVPEPGAWMALAACCVGGIAWRRGGKSKRVNGKSSAGR